MSDLDSNDEGEIPATAEREDEQAEDQVNGELMNEVDDTQSKSEEEDENYDDEEEDDLLEDELILPTPICYVPIRSLTHA
jgi:hypothetical protein